MGCNYWSIHKFNIGLIKSIVLSGYNCQSMSYLLAQIYVCHFATLTSLRFKPRYRLKWSWIPKQHMDLDQCQQQKTEARSQIPGTMLNWYLYWFWSKCHWLIIDFNNMNINPIISVYLQDISKYHRTIWVNVDKRGYHYVSPLQEWPSVVACRWLFKLCIHNLKQYLIWCHYDCVRNTVSKVYGFNVLLISALLH